MIGTTLLNRYRLDGELGRGGMGIVYRAHDVLLDRDVAVKVVSETGLGTEGRTRLLREAQATARLNHTNIVAVFDAGEADRIPFIVMELVEGKTLYEHKPASLEESLSIARQMCLALEHAHAHGIVHRDLKPENVFITPDGTAKLMDFGLARNASRLTSSGQLMGTVFYLAPEQALGQDVDQRADLYALGVVLYELTTGRLPFEGGDAVHIIAQHLHAPVVPPRTHAPSIPPALDALIVALLGKQPDDRPASARVVLDALSSDAPAAALPTGNVTFLFTDIQGSTSLWERDPNAMRESLAVHNAILHAAMAEHGGHVFKIVGDAFQVAFANPLDALNAALAAQRRLHAASWGRTGALLVRMGLHSGAAETSGADYATTHALNRVARIMSAAHGGQVLLSQEVEQQVRDHVSEQTSLRDMAKHRMKGMMQLEHLFQLVAPDLPADFPRLDTLDLTLNNLPVQLTSFIGREKEIAEVKRLLSTAPLVTLSGSGGSGKTRLALQVAAELQADFPHGVWLVELAPLADPALVLQALASALGVRPEELRPLLATLIDFLKTRTLLLVLDNCEHLIDACASLAENLLHACPKIRLLASSREALGIQGEVAFRVPSLSTPDIRRMPPLEALAQYEAVCLFVERATLALPGFALTSGNASTVAQLCHRLDGIPLAIELAAARVKLLRVEQIASRLNDRFRLLTGGSRTALPRQQTLRALIDWSYDLLSDAERTLLRRVSVFAGGWLLEAAEVVCAEASIAPGDVLDLLGQLVNKSLVVVEREQGADTRYRLLETIRQYAREKLWEAAEGEPIRNRHLDCFVQLAEQTEDELSGRDQVTWLDRLEAELDNLRGAIEWSLENDALPGLRLASALWRFLHMRGHISEGLEWLSQLLDQPQATARTALRAKALVAAAVLNVWHGDLIRGRALAEEALAIYRELSDRSGEAFALHIAGVVSGLAGDMVFAQPLLIEALAFYRSQQDTQPLSQLLVDMGSLWGNTRDTDQAQAYLAEGLALCRERGDWFNMARALNYLGMLVMWQGDFAQARSIYEESMELQRLLGAVQPIDTLQRLGAMALRQGDYAQARVHLEQSLALSQDAGQRFSSNWTFAHLGYLALRQGDAARARERFVEAQQLFEEAGLTIGVIYVLEGMASLAAQQRQPERAARLFAWADATRETIDDRRPPIEQIEVDRDLAVIHAQLDEVVFAAACVAGRALTLEQAVAYALGTDE